MTAPIDFKGRTEDTRDVESRAFQPRVMNLHAAAAYIGVSYWTMRDYIADGIVPQVTLPCSRRRKRGGAVIRRAGNTATRRLLVDIADLDALIERSKHSG
jgi:hypothetical protein